MSNPIRKGTDILGKRSGESQFVGLKAGDAVEMASLVDMDELLSVDQMVIWLDDGNSPMWPAIGPSDPGHELGIKPRFRAYLPVVILDTDEVKIYSFGIRVARTLQEMDEEFGGLAGHTFKVKRKGMGLATNYTVIPTGKNIDVDEYEMPDIIPQLGPTNRNDIVDLLVETGAVSPGELEYEEEEAERPAQKKTKRVKRKRTRKPKAKEEEEADDDEEWEDV